MAIEFTVSMAGSYPDASFKHRHDLHAAIGEEVKRVGDAAPIPITGVDVAVFRTPGSVAAREIVGHPVGYLFDAVRMMSDVGLLDVAAIQHARITVHDASASLDGECVDFTLTF